MSDGRGVAKGWPWILGVALVGLLGVLAYLMTPDGDSAWGEPGDELADRGNGEAARTPGGPAELRAPAGEAPPPSRGDAPDEATGEGAARSSSLDPSSGPAREPSALAAALLDGGAARAPEAGVAHADDDEPERYIPGPPEEPVRMGPTPPETRHRRAVFVRDLLERRIDAMRREAEAAREAGDEARLRRATRTLDRLEAQRENANAQVRAAEATVEP
ncbi:MAG TPA: hypothetical protein RMH99_17170 [Sandaracinaceae bacterium LLY-WYZ-13_1]|nr:hypothetical protein [Sandaracinaceae bacterium LLY-WYZ-13_1]